MDNSEAHNFVQHGINVHIFKDKVQLGTVASACVAETLRKALFQRGEANLILATGASQYEFLDALRQEKGVDWAQINAFHLDEYVGLSSQHPASFRRYLKERVFAYLPFKSIHLLQGDSTDPDAEARRYSDLLAACAIYVACIGIGENGHLAFNDPPADFDTDALVHIRSLDLACRQQQVGEGHFPGVDDVPQKAITLSIPAILRAGMISCVTPDFRKAQAVQCALEGPLSPECPASALRNHPNCQLFLDVHSASLLSMQNKGA